MIKEIKVEGKDIWLFVDSLRIYNEENRLIETSNKECLCYFKLDKPTSIVYGELILEDGKPKVFHSPEEAIEYAKQYVQLRIKF